MHLTLIGDLLKRQSGVVSRRQVIAAGGSDSDIERLVRRREWARVHDGVYVDHTGALEWEQRAWAALLYHWPAALTDGSALRAYGLRTIAGAETDIRIAIDGARSVTPVDGVRVKRMKGLDENTLTNLSPPRVRLEIALLGVAAATRTEDAAVGVLADGCQTRRTTPQRLLDALRPLLRLRHRRLLLTILEDIACGAYSVLERRYLVRVERPHGLPSGDRQRRVKRGKTSAYRDVEYVELDTIVELDGRLGHEATTDRWEDLDRDVDSAVENKLTLRVGWKQVLDQCRLAAAISRILLARGWTDRPRGCGAECPVSQIVVGPPAPTAGTSTVFAQK